MNFCPAELSRRLEERDSVIGQLQRSKAAIIQNHEDLKKQQEEESKVRAGGAAVQSRWGLWLRLHG